MKTLRYILTLFLVGKTLTILGQEKCICCLNYSIKNEDLYKYFFIPEYISANKIKKAIVYTTETENNKSLKSINTKFVFDSLGNITAIYDCSENGIPYVIKEFFRDNSNRIIKTSSTSINPDETICDRWKKISDFEYNQAGLLKKTTEKEFIKGKLIPENLSNKYVEYEYDTNNRLIKEFSYAKVSDYILTYERVIKYQNKNESIEFDKNNGVVCYKTISHYDDKNRLISQIYYDYPNNNILRELYYEFDLNKLKIQISKDVTLGTECPDDNEFSEVYVYDDFGLLEKVTHKFGDVTCEMTIKYE